jgi:hypothetical protein
VRERVEDVRAAGEAWVRDRLARDREALAGPASGPQVAGPRAGPAHAVTLGMRWFRADGSVSPSIYGDVLRHVLEGRPDPTSYTVSTTRPPTAFDMDGPPAWTPPNPKPERRVAPFNWRP